MKIEELKKLATAQSKQRARSGRSPKDGKSVYIVHYSSKSHLDQVGLNVYEEGKTGLFAYDYWIAVFAEKEKRIYILPADKSTGYHAQKKAESGARNIHFTNKDMSKFIEELGANHKGFNWKFDTECRKWFINLDNKYDKKVEKKSKQEDLEAFWSEA